MKLIENIKVKSDLSELSILSEPSIVKFIENQSEHLSKLTLYHLKKRATRRSRRANEPSRIPPLFLRGLNKKNSMLKKFVFKKISTIEIPKSSAKLHRYDSKVRKPLSCTMMSLHAKKVLLQTFVFREHETLKHPSDQLK